MRVFALVLFATLPGTLPADDARTFTDVAELSVRFEPKTARPGETIKLLVTLTPRPDCYTYPVHPPDDQTAKNVLKAPSTPDITFAEQVTDPQGWKEKAGVEPGKNDRYYSASVTWEIVGVVAPTATPGTRTIALTGSRLQACNDKNCFYTDRRNPPSAMLEIVAGAAAAPPPGVTSTELKPVRVEPPAAATNAPVSTGLVTKTALPTAEYTARLNEVQSQFIGDNTLPTNSIGGFLATAAIWGWISLVTPCVFPMIPITVSLFLKQGNKAPGEVLKLAGVYCLTIILVIGLSAVALLSVFRQLSVDPIMNLGLGLLLIVFALSLFGMFDLTLPGFLLRATERRRGAGGLLGTVFGALAFSIVSFTCVAPFLGGFAGMAASGQFSQVQLVLGGLVFATAFASPFFLLALFPSLIKKMPRSGGWLDTIKAVMGFLELAAALKFFRTAELRLLPQTEYFTYDLCLAGIIVVSGLCGLYLLNLFRLPHDEERPTIGVGRLLWAIGFLGLALYLTPGLFKTGEGANQRPSGVVYAWIDAFLLPEPTGVGGKEFPWSSDLPTTLAMARKETGTRRLIFVDFTGKTCQNCKYNEFNIFPKPTVERLLRQYSLVQLYTDEVPAEFYRTAPSKRDRDAEAAANEQFQKAAFGDEKLPLYAILEPLPDGKIRKVAVYDEGKINNADRFVEFLQKPLTR